MEFEVFLQVSMTKISLGLRLAGILLMRLESKTHAFINIDYDIVASVRHDEICLATLVFF